jgi:hypothetical protein
MFQFRRLTLAALVLVAELVFTGTACAGPLKDWLFPAEAPSPSYSPLHYWAPALERVNDKVHGPKLNVYSPDRHPEIPPTFTILRFSHPAADPAATLIEPPTPPATSRFRY